MCAGMHTRNPQIYMYICVYTRTHMLMALCIQGHIQTSTDGTKSYPVQCTDTQDGVSVCHSGNTLGRWKT